MLVDSSVSWSPAHRLISVNLVSFVKKHLSNLRLPALVSSVVLAIVLVAVPTPAHAIPCPVNVSAFNNSGQTYAACDFRGWDFSGRTISNTDFSISYLGSANFGRNGVTPTTLDTVQFGNAINTDVNFTHTIFTNVTIYLTNFNGSDFSDSVFTGGTLRDAHFSGASFINANMNTVTLDNVWLEGANLSYSNVTQAQLDHAHLTADTICPDTFPLGDHVGNCFSSLKAPIPTTTAPVVSSTGFTFDITNNNTDFYTFTVAVTAGPGVATTGTPSGSNLPVTVTGAPPGSPTVVTITGSIGSGGSQVTSTTLYNYQDEVAKELARTGLSENSSLWTAGSAALLMIIGALGVYLSRKPRTSRH